MLINEVGRNDRHQPCEEGEERYKNLEHTVFDGISYRETL